MAERIRGTIEHIIFRNEENGYTVLTLLVSGKELTAVGFFQSVGEGECVEATGEYTEHSLYGRQFSVSSYTLSLPDSKDGIQRYLASGAVKGIGQALAEKIVKRFGEDTLRILEEEPERLSEIRGISLKKAQMIAAQTQEQRAMRRAMIALQEMGLGVTLSARIYEAYGEEVFEILLRDPYRLADEVKGVGFHTADQIAFQNGIQKENEKRITAGILYLLSEIMAEGNLFLPENELLGRASELLQVDPQLIRHGLETLLFEHRVIQKRRAKEDDPDSGMPGGQEFVYYPGQAYYLELNTARMLTDMNIPIKEDAARNWEASGLSAEQAKAVRQAAENGVFLLTGGPGTGKTMTINEMIRFFLSRKLEIALAAPTGRAAKRMTEMTGYEASTIHRLLEVQAPSADGEEARFARNDQNPLSADVVIIDEMSMVDIYLMHSLLLALRPGTRLILVGDADQLPSVGPGAVLRDMLKTEVFPCVSLSTIFRQEEAGDIIVNAHRVNRGESLKLDNRSDSFFFLERDEAQRIIHNIIELVRDKLPPYVEATPFDIQVLVPMRKGPLGVEQMNAVLQTYLNPSSPLKAEKQFGDRLFRVGDKVMQMKNNYELRWEVLGKYNIPVEEGQGVFNGDMGIVREVDDFLECLRVEFDEGRMADIPYADLHQLELAYAVTIHKSQGSEYPAVVLPLLFGPQALFSRKLLYTAVTRARRCVTILGSRRTVDAMIANIREDRRYTSLDERILEFCPWNK